MGAKTWMLAYADGNVAEALGAAPVLDRDASAALAKRLFPSAELTPLADGDLSFTSPPRAELLVGCFPGVSIVAAKEIGIDYPSKLPARFLEESSAGSVYLHAMHSVVDWFAYAVWRNGKLIRSLSVAPDNGVIEDIGARWPFEEPFWSGKHPVPVDDDGESAYPLPFHPLELGEAALKELFGYQLEAMPDPALLEPDRIPLARFKRSKPWWRLW